MSELFFDFAHKRFNSGFVADMRFDPSGCNPCSFESINRRLSGRVILEVVDDGTFKIISDEDFILMV